MKKLSIQMRERCGLKFLKTTLQAEPEQQAVQTNRSAYHFGFKTESIC